jgi:predicted DNA-binding transcriptional regulator YafY
MRNAEVIRQWQVLREIETRRAGVTIHELASLVSVSTRTIRRDLQALQEAGFAVYDEGEENETKRWRLDGAPFKAVQDGLSVSDVAALYLSRTVVEGLSGWPLEDELRAAFEKLERALNPRMREFLSTLPQVISAKAGPRSPSHSVRQIDATRRLFDAARDRRVVEMRYFSATANRVKAYTVQPYRLALAQGGLYLVAWVPAYDEFRTFATERIERLSVTDETFKRTRELPARLFGSSMGVFTGEPERIEITFAARVAMVVRSRIWHDSQELADLPDGGIRMTLFVSNDWALRSWLLGFGSAARVLSPAALASAIAEECRHTLDLYTSAK